MNHHGIRRMGNWREWLAAATLMIGAVVCGAAPESLYLTNCWKLARTPDVASSGGQISQTNFDTTAWAPAVVPGTVLTSYAAAGLISNPYFGTNMAVLSQPYYNTNYWYRETFAAPADFAGQKVWLNFDGINWKADIYLNGNYVGRINGPFIRGKFDVTSVVVPGATNALAVLIYWSDATVWDAPTFLGSESWDFMPAIPGRNVGIYENVYLSTSGPVTLVDPFVTTDLPLPATSPAAVSITVGLTNSSAAAVNGVLQATINPEGITVSQAVHVPASSMLNANFTPGVFPLLSIANPALWWPNGYGAQNLHQLVLTFQSGVAVSDQQTVTFGIRKFSYDTNGHDLQLHVNGQKIMCKGGNWGMPDALLGFTPQQMDTAVRLHQLMNFTMIRAWHGNNDFESFYDACDKYGILVWDEWWLNGSQVGIVPNDVPMFNTNAIDKIKRLRNRACLAVWCGENEAVPPPSIDSVLSSACSNLDGTRIYIEASNAGPIHGGVTYSVQDPAWYYSVASGFTTEIGSPCIPTVETMRAMMPATSLWPIGDTNWGYHDWKTDIGNKGLPQYAAAVTNRYGNVTNIDGFCREAQLLNYETYRAIFEAWNSRLWNDCSGVLLWMSHQVWPSTIWQTFDHSFDLGGAFFGCQKACEPVHIQWNYDDCQIRVINNTSNALNNVSAQAQVFNSDGTSKYLTNLAGLNIPANSAAICGAVFNGNNLALGRPAVASSVTATNVAANAVDGSSFTRWESQYSDPQWLYVDLGAPRSFDTVVIHWEAAYGKAYQIQVSGDASAWTNIYSTTTGAGGYDTIAFPPVTARYVRLYGTQRGTIFGYSIYEFSVYATGTAFSGMTNLSSVHFLKLKLLDAGGNLLSDNLYWRGTTPLSYAALNSVPPARVTAYSSSISDGVTTRLGITVQNSGAGVAVAARLKLLQRSSGARVLPAFYSDNYFFLLPNESRVVTLEYANADLGGDSPQLMLEGWNIATNEVPIGSGPNLALGRPATASSQESAALSPTNAVDGDASTRWSSAYSDPQWLEVDLGSVQGVNRVRLLWETAFAKAYSIQVSDDGSSWRSVYSTTNGAGGLEDISFAPTNARYIRMYGTQRGTIFGYSLYEFEVYGPTYRLSCLPLDAGHVRLSWDSVPQQDYEIQSAADLTAAIWTTEGSTIKSSDVQTTASVSTADAPQRFYRIKAVF